MYLLYICCNISAKLDKDVDMTTPTETPTNFQTLRQKAPSGPDRQRQPVNRRRRWSPILPLNLDEQAPNGRRDRQTTALLLLNNSYVERHETPQAGFNDVIAPPPVRTNPQARTFYPTEDPRARRRLRFAPPGQE